jgi:hypothetical protein
VKTAPTIKPVDRQRTQLNVDDLHLEPAHSAIEESRSFGPDYGIPQRALDFTIHLETCGLSPPLSNPWPTVTSPSLDYDVFSRFF